MLRVLCLALALGLYAPCLAQAPLAVPPPLVPPALSGPRIFFSDQTNDAIYWCQDLNGNGHCNDPGEVGVFFDSTSPDANLHLQTPRYVVMGPDGSLYVGDSNRDFILRLTDLNQDGDANDAGEASIFYDNLSGGPLLGSINNMAFDGSGALFISDSGASSTDRHVTRMRDDDNDGYCTAVAGEVQLIYSFTTTTGLILDRPAGLVIDADGTLLLSEYFATDNIYRLVDTVGALNGDANDLGEQVLYFASDSLGFTLDFAESMAFAPPVAGFAPTLYVNSGSVQDRVYRFHDANGDGVIDNPGEVTIYWDTTQADGLVPVTLFRMAVATDGTLFATEAGSSASGVTDRLMALSDLNGNGTVNDGGEVRVYLDGTNAAGFSFGQVMGIAVEILPPAAPGTTFVRGDCNIDGSNNIADAVFLLSFLFPSVGGPPVLHCEDACDGNDDGALNIADAIRLLGALFGSPSVPLPAPQACGVDPDLVPGCGAFGACP